MRVIEPRRLQFMPVAAGMSAVQITDGGVRIMKMVKRRRAQKGFTARAAELSAMQPAPDLLWLLEHEITPEIRARLDAFLRTQSYSEAAKLCGSDRETVAATCRAYLPLYAAAAEDAVRRIAGETAGVQPKIH